MRKESLKKIIIQLVLMVPLLFGIVPYTAVTAWADSTENVDITVEYGQTEARNMLTTINNFRQGSEANYIDTDNVTTVNCSGLEKLTYDYELEETAMQRAAEIAVYYSHTRPNGGNCFAAFPSGINSAGENIAYGYRTASEVFIGWKEDGLPYAQQGHRRNMLNSDFNCIGIGHVIYNGTHYWTQSLAKRSSPYTTKPTALDGKKKVTVNVNSSNVEKAYAGNISMLSGETADLPKVYFTNSNPPKTEFLYVPTGGSITWTVSDPTKLVIEGDKVKAIGSGEVVLRTTAFGKDVTSKVTIATDISAAEIAIDSTNLIYKGSAQTPAVTVKVGGVVLKKDVDYTLSYENNVSVTDAARAIVKGKGAYSGEKSATFSIQKAPLTIKAKNNTITYGDAPANNGLEYTGFVGGDGASVLSGKPEFEYDYTQYGGVGEYSITPKGLTSDNYEISFEAGTLTVEQKEAELDWGQTKLTYNGEEQIPEVEIKGLVNNDECSAVVTGAKRDLGTYTAKVESLSNSNYKLPPNPEIEFTIAKAEAKVIKEPTALTDLTYNGQSLKLIEPGSAENGEMRYALGLGSFVPYDSDFSDEIPTAVNAGEYTVYYKVFGDENFADTEVYEIEAEIEKADHEDVSASGSAKYGKSGEVDLSALIEDEGSIQDVSIVDSGTSDEEIFYYSQLPYVYGGMLYFRFADNADYIGQTVTVSALVEDALNYDDYDINVVLKVLSKDVPVLSAERITVEYSGSEVPDSLIKGSAKVGDTEIEGTWKFKDGEERTEVSDSGVKTVIFIPDDSENYEMTETTLVLTISDNGGVPEKNDPRDDNGSSSESNTPGDDGDSSGNDDLDDGDESENTMPGTDGDNTSENTIPGTDSGSESENTIPSADSDSESGNKTPSGNAAPSGNKVPSGNKAPSGNTVPSGNKAPSGNTVPSEDARPDGDSGKVGTFTVTFDTGKYLYPVPAMTVSYGSLIQKPVPEGKPGCEFTRWYISREKSGTNYTYTYWDFERDRVYEDITLHARYKLLADYLRECSAKYKLKRKIFTIDESIENLDDLKGEIAQNISINAVKAASDDAPVLSRDEEMLNSYLGALEKTDIVGIYRETGEELLDIDFEDEFKAVVKYQKSLSSDTVPGLSGNYIVNGDIEGITIFPRGSEPDDHPSESEPEYHPIECKAEKYNRKKKSFSIHNSMTLEDLKKLIAPKITIRSIKSVSADNLVDKSDIKKLKKYSGNLEAEDIVGIYKNGKQINDLVISTGIFSAKIVYQKGLSAYNVKGLSGNYIVNGSIEGIKIKIGGHGYDPKNTVSANVFSEFAGGYTISYPEYLPYCGKPWKKIIKDNRGIINIVSMKGVAVDNNPGIKAVSIKKSKRPGNALIKRIKLMDGTKIKCSINLEIFDYYVDGDKAREIFDTSKMIIKNGKIKGLRINFSDLNVNGEKLNLGKSVKVSPKYVRYTGSNEITFSGPFIGTISANLIDGSL